MLIDFNLICIEGVPKGVVLPHSALVATVKAFHFVVDPVKPGDIYLGTVTWVM